MMKYQDKVFTRKSDVYIVDDDDGYAFIYDTLDEASDYIKSIKSDASYVKIKIVSMDNTPIEYPDTTYDIYEFKDTLCRASRNRTLWVSPDGETIYLEVVITDDYDNYYFDYSILYDPDAPKFKHGDCVYSNFGNRDRYYVYDGNPEIENIKDKLFTFDKEKSNYQLMLVTNTLIDYRHKGLNTKVDPIYYTYFGTIPNETCSHGTPPVRDVEEWGDRYDILYKRSANIDTYEHMYVDADSEEQAMWVFRDTIAKYNKFVYDEADKTKDPESITIVPPERII